MGVGDGVGVGTGVGVGAIKVKLSWLAHVVLLVSQQRAVYGPAAVIKIFLPSALLISATQKDLE